MAGLGGRAGQAGNPGQQAEIAAGGHGGGFAAAVVLGIGGLGTGGEQPSLAGAGLDEGTEGILHGHHGQIAARRELGVAARAHLGTGHGHVPPGGHVQVAPGGHGGAGMGDAVLPAFGAAVKVKFLGDGAYGQIPPGGQGHVAPGVEAGAPDGKIVVRHGGYAACGFNARLGLHVPVGGVALVRKGEGLRNNVAPGRQGDVAALEVAAVVGDIVQSCQVQRAPAQQAAGVLNVDRGQVHAFAADKTLVHNALARIDIDVFGLHAAARHNVRLCGRGQVEMRHKHLFAHVLFFHQPDDILGQRRHLIGREGHARREFKALSLGDGRIHQAAHLVRVRTVAIQKAPARGAQNLLLYQARLVKGVAQQNHLLAVLVQTDAAEKIVGTVKEAHIREHGIGFNQIMVARRG